ncbi:ATP-dependent helicase [Streptomyces sp. WAC 06738]|uniref:DEAD/DEAH box helicase n=1 Tax=Streptomyces sp. WAC 06738 TaxID=2203210 RepID=UPI000F6FA888|nr:DEAD/DEAH box helicase [Streptomyces sp. WAC 06738]AZM44817.1 ATP-dependent helicase [Streptomyces sp. WAC 06738]
MTALPLLSRCAALFLPADPARTGRMAFWLPDDDRTHGQGPGPAAGPPDHPRGTRAALTVAGPGGGTREVPALLLPAADALPVLTRARAAHAAGADGVHPAAVFWGTAALLALRLAARGKLLPGLSEGAYDAWRCGPLGEDDVRELRELAAAMPPEAHAAPQPRDGASDTDPVLLPGPEHLLRAFLDAVADGLPRSPAAVLAAGGRAFAAPEPRHVPEQRAWADDVAAGHDAGVRVSLRVDMDTTGDRPAFRAVVQLHGTSDPTLLADAADVWAGTAAHFGPGARMQALLTLRRAAHAWDALTPLLSAAVPDAVDLGDDDLAALLGPGARDLAAAGVEIHWPRDLTRHLTARAVVGPADDPDGRRPGPSYLSADALVAFGWRYAVGDVELTRAELDRLAEAARPVVRLRDRWVLVDPESVRRALDRKDADLTPVDALGAALTGEIDDPAVPGGRVEVAASGWLDTLRKRIADPEEQSEPTAPPAALAATLRDYQLRGLGWLRRMTSLGLGGCLADDMGLGKTITLISLHLDRQEREETAGPTLVVCPASLLGNWQREIERFAPGTPVRRFHGGGRSLEALADGEFVLTTYGTMRLDAGRLAEAGWSLVVADEAQHVKNPFSATAKALRTIPSRARVALTGTPVENNLSELWAILDWTTPGLLGPLRRFRTRYADAAESGAGWPGGSEGDGDAAERLARLVRPFLLRRRKSDPGIAPELPRKTETDRAVALTVEQAGLYEAVVRETLAAIAEADAMARRGLILKLMTALKQICNHPAQYLKEDDPRIPGRSGKLELLDELLDVILAEGGSVLVFTQYVRMARLLGTHLAARGVPAQLLHGGTPVPEREELVRRFQDGEVPVFLLSLKAAGTGLNLTRAGHVVHYDRWWNPAVEAQATDRAYRIGQTQPVQVHRLVAEGTIEDRIAQMLQHKQGLADAVLGGAGEAAITELSDGQLAELVRLAGPRGGE